MSTPIIIKQSNIPGKIPTTADIELSELAINTYDGKAYLKRNQNGSELIVNVGGGYPGFTYYVSKNGLDTNDGKSLGSSFLTLRQALTVVVSGDTIEISAGTYTEIFPLTIPSGVTVRGGGLRSTFIQPTVGTQRLDAFYLNGETTIEDLSIGNFYYNSSADTGYGFKFAPNMVTTTRSPYIQRVSVINKGSITSSTDPYGFDTPDNYPTTLVAGRGALIDASVVQSTTLEPAMLFNECTFIIPNQTALKMINGARTEWVNCFTYFANKGIDAISGSVGVGSTANITLRLSGVTTSSISANYVVKYYQSGVPVAIGTVVSTSGISTATPYLELLGKGSGVFNAVGIGSTQDIRIFQSNGTTQVGTASTILWADYQKFGADVRSIGSATNFGNIGVSGDGPGVQVRLFGFNFECVGSGKTFTQDPTLTIQSNEAVQTNGGRVYFQSVDQAGNFRVGTIFQISQETGAVSLASTSDININGTATIQNISVTGISTLSGAVGLSTSIRVVGVSTFIDSMMLGKDLYVSGITTTGNFRVTGVSTLTGNTNFTNNVNISGITTTATFRVTGISTLTGDVELSNNLRTSGVSTFVGNVMLSNNLNVAGITTTATLRVTGISTLTGDVILSGNLRTVGVSTFVGNVMLSNNLNVAGITTTATFRVTGISTLTGDVELTNNLRTSGVSTFVGNVMLSNNLNVAGITTTATFRVTGVSTLGGDVLLSNNLYVTGLSTFTNTISHNSQLFITNQSTYKFIDTTTATVSAFGDATTIGIGSTNATLTLRPSTVVGTNSIQTLYNTIATSVNAFGNATNIVLGSTTGVSTFRSDLSVTGTVTAGNFATAGIATFSGSANNLNQTAGTAALNRLTVAGVSTLGSFTFGTTGIITGPSEIIIDPSAVGDNTGSVRIAGDFYVDGTTTTVNSKTLEIGDILIGIGTTALGNDALADGGGIKLYGLTNKTLTWVNSTSSWTSSENFDIATTKIYSIGGINFLSEQELTVPNAAISGLTTLGNLNVTGIGSISTAYINSGFATDFRVTNEDIQNLYVLSGIITNFVTSGIGTIVNLNSTDAVIAGFSTITNISNQNLYSVSGIITTLNGTNLNYGIGTVTTFNYITGTGTRFTANSLVASELNISGITTTTSLNVADIVVTGVSTIPTISVSNLYGNSGIITYLSGTNINYSGIGSFGTIQNINTPGLSTITSLIGVNLNYSGVTTTNQLITTSFYSTGIGSISDLRVNSGISTRFDITNLNIITGTAFNLEISTVTGTFVGLNTNIVGVNTSGLLIGDNVSGTYVFPGSTVTIVGVGNVTLSFESSSPAGTSTTDVTFTRQIIPVGIATIPNLDTNSANINFGTANNLIVGINSVNTLYVNSGIATVLNVISGIVTSLNVSGISTSAESVVVVGVSTHQKIVNLNVIGISTFSNISNVYSTGISTISYLTGTNLSYTGIATFSDGLNVNNLYISGICTAQTLEIITGISTSHNIVNLNVGVGTASYLNITDENVGYSTISNANITTLNSINSYLSNNYVTNLYVNSGIATVLNVLSGIVTSLYVGISSIGDLYVNSGIHTRASIGDLNVTGVGTFATIQNINTPGLSTISYLTGTNISYSGIGTITRLYSTNSTLLDIYSTGISTLTSLYGSDISYSGISTLTNLSGTQFYYSGISTAVNFSSTDEIVSGASSITTLRANVGYITAFYPTNSYSSGITSIATLYVNSGVVTTLTATNSTQGYLIGTNFYYSGIGSISNLKSDVGVVTSLSGTNLNYSGIATVTSLIVTDINLTGVGTFNSIQSSLNNLTYITNTNINSSGIGTIPTLNSTRGNITSVDGTDARLSGIATISNIQNVNSVITGIATITDLKPTNIYSTGISTFNEIIGNSLRINVLDLSASNLYFSGIATFATLYSTNSYLTSVTGSNLQYTGVSTISRIYNVDINSTGIVTTYGLNVGAAGTILNATAVGGIGSVGINTISANKALHVYGDIQIRGNTVVGTISTTLTSNVTIGVHNALARADYRSVEYTIQTSIGNTHQVVKVVSVHDGVTAYNSEYANISTGVDVASYDVTIDNSIPPGFIRLDITPVSNVGVTTVVVNFIANRI
jgi:hypothetical protein